MHDHENENLEMYSGLQQQLSRLQDEVKKWKKCHEYAEAKLVAFKQYQINQDAWFVANVILGLPICEVDRKVREAAMRIIKEM